MSEWLDPPVVSVTLAERIDAALDRRFLLDTLLELGRAPRSRASRCPARRPGSGEFLRRLSAAWNAFADRVPELLEIETATGADALGRVYDAFLAGTADQRKGYVFRL